MGREGTGQRKKKKKEITNIKEINKGSHYTASRTSRLAVGCVVSLSVPWRCLGQGEVVGMPWRQWREWEREPRGSTCKIPEGTMQAVLELGISVALIRAALG